MMVLRLKLVCRELSSDVDGDDVVFLKPVIDENRDPEVWFHTPIEYDEIGLGISDYATVRQFSIGKTYYLDITEAED
jgi:hypothetical protein